ncbi:MAG: septum formation protein Maf [Prevotella sp.]|nr:septum formation protein Maf [Prevotella sp.]
MHRIVLASNSPRRKELLAGLDIPFSVRVLDGIDESYPPMLSPVDIPQFLAKNKAEAYKSTMADDEVVITADTVVVLDEEVLGKPADRADAVHMLKELSGKTHQVITGVCLTTTSTQRVFGVTTEVTFKAFTDEEINYYVDTYKPMDKAGAYGIQEWIGYVGVTALNGSYFNVMGLPVQRIYAELQKMGILFIELEKKLK